jgi:hypothetical protein
MTETSETKIAVLQAEVFGLREQHKEQSNLLRNELQEVKNELKTIAVQINRREGATSALLLVASFVGGLVALVGKMLFYGKPPV